MILYCIGPSGVVYSGRAKATQVITAMHSLHGSGFRSFAVMPEFPCMSRKIWDIWLECRTAAQNLNEGVVIAPIVLLRKKQEQKLWPILGKTGIPVPPPVLADSRKPVNLVIG